MAANQLEQRVGWWSLFGVGYIAPAILSANLQSWRKFIEHMGLFGDTPTTLSRTVVHQSAAGRILAVSMLNVSHHGTHHRYGGIAFEQLPETTRCRFKEDDPLTFPNYRQALWAMLPSLADPRVGSQWIVRPEMVRPVRRAPKALANDPRPTPARAVELQHPRG